MRHTRASWGHLECLRRWQLSCPIRDMGVALGGFMGEFVETGETGLLLRYPHVHALAYMAFSAVGH